MAAAPAAASGTLAYGALLLVPPALAAAGVMGPGGLMRMESGAEVLAPLLTMGLFVSPAEVLRAVVQAKSPGPYSAFPYITMQANCFLWLAYAAQVGNMAILLPNALGLVLASATLGAFLLYSPAASRAALMKKLLFSIGAPALFLLSHPPLSTLGLCACLFTIAMFASPLVQLRTVVQQRDSASLPFAQLLMAYLSCCSWVVYGACIGNPHVLVPNAIGAVLSAGQLLVYRLYRRP